MLSNYTVSAGYVHWRKTQYEKDSGVLDISALHEAQLNSLPHNTSTINIAELEQFLNNVAPPIPSPVKFSDGKHTANQQNILIGQTISNDIQNLLKNLALDNNMTSLEWTKHKNFANTTRVYKKDLLQL